MSEEAVENNPFQELVRHALDQDYNKANKIFGDLMGTKVNDALDQEKIRLADQIYNGVADATEDDDDIMGDEDGDVQGGSSDRADDDAEEGETEVQVSDSEEPGDEAMEEEDDSVEEE